jgi:protein-disulfide isomerase
MLANLHRSLTVRTAHSSLRFAVILGVGLTSCKKPPAGSTAPGSASSAGAPSGSTDLAAAAAASGPCGAYAEKLCETAGSDTPTCQSIKTATELMPPEACTAGMKNIDFSVKKLAVQGQACDELVKKLCEAVGPETQSCKLVSGETKKFGSEKCKMMMQHLPEVVAELKSMEDANKPLTAEMQAAIAAPAPSSFGPANAKVQIVEFSDFQCPFCSQAANVVHQIREKYGDKVRFTFRQFPLPMHPNAKEAAEAALAAGTQGKFWEYHDRLFKNQKALDRSALEEHAKETGLNLAAFKKSLDEHKFAPAVEADVKLGEKVQVNGTPSMFINGQRVANPTNFEAIAALIESALKGGAPPG